MITPLVFYSPDLFRIEYNTKGHFVKVGKAIQKPLFEEPQYYLKLLFFNKNRP